MFCIVNYERSVLAVKEMYIWNFSGVNKVA